MLDGEEGIVGATALCELAVAMQTHHLNGAVHVGLVGNESLAEVECLVGLSQQFSLEERECAIVPAGSRTVLVLDAGDGVCLDSGEYGLVGLLTVLLLSCACIEGQHGRHSGQDDFLHE